MKNFEDSIHELADIWEEKMECDCEWCPETCRAMCTEYDKISKSCDACRDTFTKWALKEAEE